MSATSLGGPGPWLPPHGRLFEELVRSTKATLRYEARRGVTASVGAIYWYQGENDASEPSLAGQYRTNLTTFLRDIRSEVPTAGRVPIVLAQESLGVVIAVGRAFHPPCPACATLEAGDTQVRAADVAVARTLPGVAVVDTLGLPRTGLGVHLSAAGDLRLGTELADASIAAGLGHGSMARVRKVETATPRRPTGSTARTGGDQAGSLAMSQQSPVGKSQNRARLSGGAIASITGVGLLIIFMVQNTEKVTLHFLVWNFSWPLWLFTLVTAVFGALVWFGLGVMRRHRRRVERREYRRD